MTDYNDGKWHGWNGGYCPVHPKSVVDACGKPDLIMRKLAEEFHWPNCIVFRVVTAYREPREFWIVNGSVAFASLTAAQALCEGNEGYTITHVREVLE